jgi:hypothetical protein
LHNLTTSDNKQNFSHKLLQVQAHSYSVRSTDTGVSYKLYSLRFDYTSREISKKVGCSKSMYTSRMPIKHARTHARI